MFGSRKRRKAKEALANEFKGYAAEKQTDIDAAEIVNPFEGAAAKSAMTNASRKIKQQQNRYMNLLGANASPEAIIASQGASQEAIGGAAGQIAAGAEATKEAKLAQLRGEKLGLMGQSAGIQQSSIDERGSGWNTLFQGLNALGGVAEGVGGVI